MTILRTREDLYNAMTACIERVPDNLPYVEQTAWFENDPESVRLSDLFHVYQEALMNPPEGVIGVGCISYADAQLVAAQA